ncbi:MAG: Ig-like domain-containing protein, partial [Thermoanaerobaculales bacterium]
LRESADAVWYYEPAGGLKAGANLSLATMLGGDLGSPEEAFYNADLDSWYFQGPPSDWSGQIVLPVIEGAPLTVIRRDVATGWLLSSQSYGNPDDPDGDGVIPLDALLAPDPGPPRLVGAIPFDLIRFAPPRRSSSQLLRLDLEAVADGEGKVSLQSPAGFELSPDAGVALYEVSNPVVMQARLGPAFVCSGSVLGNKTEPGKDLLAVVGSGDLDPGILSELRFTFSRAIDSGIGDLDPNDVAILTDRGPAASCSGVEATTTNVAVKAGDDLRTLIVRPLTALSAGRRYRLELKTGALFPGICPAGDDAASAPPCAAPRSFFFTTRKVSDEPVATGGVAGLDNVRTLARIGNLLFAGSLDGRVVATDLSGGQSPVVGQHVHHAEMVQGAVSQVRAFATDGHGRLFLNVLAGGTWSIKAIAVEDVIGAPPGGTFSVKSGGVRTSYSLGSELGSISELSALSALPLATPVDLDLVVRDQVGEALELEAFCAANGCSDQLEDPPDVFGYYEVELDPVSLTDRPAPVARPDLCDEQPDTDKYQRISLDNTATGQTWSVDLLTADWGGPSAPALRFKARIGDQLRLRYNLQTLGFVALLGSGITVVDLNRFYDAPMSGFNPGLAQCGRRLGKYEGAEIDLEGCGPGGLRYGIDMTPSVGVLGPTGCDGDSCARGPGQIHLYSPLMSMGLVHGKALEKEPGAVQDGQLLCTAGVSGVFHHDVELVTGVSWLDRGLRSSGPGQPFVVENQARNDKPETETGDLLFMSLGSPGIYVFEVSSRTPRLIGRLHKPGHDAFRLQAEPDLGVLLAGGAAGLLDVWDLANVNVAPVEDLGAGVEGAAPRPLATLDNVPWGTDRLGVDLAGSGLIFAWDGGSAAAVAIPLRRPQPILAGVYRADGEPEGDGPPPRELRPTRVLVPLGIPTELSLERERSRRATNDRHYTAAFKVRLALPGYLGETLTAKVESLRVRPPEEHLADADLGPAKVPPGGPGWPDSEAEVTLRRLADADAGISGRFGQAYNLYESDEIVLLIADPRAAEGYTPQGEPPSPGDPPVIDTEAGQCRRCERPEILTDSDNVVEMLAGGPYLRVVLDVAPGSPLDAFFRDDSFGVPAAVAEVAGWADDVPSPVQVSLAEPPLGAAGWSPGE